MNDAFHVGGVGLSSQQKALDLIANNITNMNTAGYKRGEMRFSEVMAGRAGAASAGSEGAVAGMRAAVHAELDAQGQIERTGDAMDVAIEGRGFLEVMGPRGETLLWRGGRMGVGPDGMLTAGNAMPLAGLINVPLEADGIELAADGTVRALMSDGSGGVEAREIGQLRVVRAGDPSALERLDGGYCRAGAEAQLYDAHAGEDGAGVFVQGGVERSNVDMNAEMVRLMITQRAYAASAQVVQAADQVMSIANSLRR